MKKIKFMEMPMHIADALQVKEMLLVVGGNNSDTEESVNNGSGLCSGVNNGNGRCLGSVNNGGGLCG